MGVAVDGAGNLLIADTGNDRIRVVAASTGTFYGQPMTAGDIYTVAGNGTRRVLRRRRPGHRGRARRPGRRGGGRRGQPADRRHQATTGSGWWRPSTGTFYGQAMTAGDIYTVAGDGKHGFSGDGGPATAAELSLPGRRGGWTRAGNLVIADTGNNRIRVVAASTGTFYGQAMTAGDIYTVAGDGSRGSPATAARPPRPSSTARRAWRWTARATC